MNKIEKKSWVILVLGVFLLSIFFIGFVNAKDSVSNSLDGFVNSSNSYDNFSIIYGDNAAFEDLMGALMISDIFPIITGTSGQPYIKKSSEVLNYKNKNLILVGGPCANPISEEITNEKGYNCEDWKFNSGEAVVKVFDNGDGKAIMVAGTTKEDTLKMADAIRRYDKSDKLKSSDEVIFNTPIGNECGNGICEIKETDAICPADCSNEGSVQLTSKLIVQNFHISGENIVFGAFDVSEPSENLIRVRGKEVSGTSKIYLLNLKTNETVEIDKGFWPQIDEDYLVYEGRKDILNENTGAYVEWPVIKLYRISTGETIQLTEPKIRYYFEWPIISGNNVVWLERNEVYGDTNPPKLMIYNIETKSTKKLVNVRNYWDSNFKIDGNYIVYQGPKYCVPEDCSQVKSEPSPGNFVYENAEEGDQDVWLYDISTDKKTRITSNEEYQGMPEVWNNYLVWVDDSLIAEGIKEIHVYDIFTGEENPLNLTYIVSGGSKGISFSDNKVVWTDYRNENGDVYLYDIIKNVERRITFNSGFQGSGEFEENHVIWIDSRNGGQDLFMVDL
jgi:beta propeller repeat protein